VSKFVLRSWVLNYQTHGKDIFTHKPRNRSYTKAFKEQVVHEYVQGKASMFTLSAEHDISIRMISKWVQVYYIGGEQNAYEPKGEVYCKRHLINTTSSF
jgi:transposase